MAKHAYPPVHCAAKSKLVQRSKRHYYAEIAPQPLPAQSAAIEALIEVAFGDLGAQHLELRVADASRRKGFCS